MDSVKEAKQLKEDLDNLRPIDSEAEKRIMQKFRLDWNYHSNNLEGNSLTYGETKALILFGITAQGKPLKDHFEITGHDEAIKWIEEVVKDEISLTEKFIREVHTLLLKESSFKEAKTNEGTPTRRKIEVGKYKTQPNHVVTVTGETFYFATPEETPAKMQELLEWFRKEKEKAKVNPILLASLFHYRFIRIHPFDDGNGRVARILMNFILMQFGYPPAIIKTEDKENYYAVLRLADADELEPFIEYIAKNLVYSLKIMIRGSKGEDIEEADDLDKELTLLDRKLEFLGDKAGVELNGQTFPLFIENILLPLINNIFLVCKKFERFYTSVNYVMVTNPSHFVTTKRSSKSTEFHLSKVSIEQLKQLIINEFLYPVKNRIAQEITVGCSFNSFSRVIKENISYISKISILFYDRYYSILNDEGKTLLQKGYDNLISDFEMQKILKQISDNHKNFINTEISKIAESKDIKESSP